MKLACTRSLSDLGRLFAVSASLLLFAGGGCGGDPPPGSQEPSLTLEEYREAFAETMCDWRARCNLELSVAECRASWRFSASSAYEEQALEAGTIAFDGVEAQRCVDAIAERSCESDAETEEAEASCGLVFVGQVAPEEPCMVSEECVGDAVCGFNPSVCDGTVQCCPGACRLFPGPAEIGESCVNQTVNCVEGAFCARDPETFQPTVCQANVEIGGSCELGEGCVDEGFCDGNTQRCAPRIAVGERCEFGGCVEGAVCWWDDDFTDQRCEALLTPAGLGESCIDPILGSVGCLHVGAACTDGICELRRGIGEACGDGVTCAFFATCDSGLGQCVAKVGEGEPCGWNEDTWEFVGCAGNLQCDADTCVFAGDTSETEVCPVPGEPLDL